MIFRGLHLVSGFFSLFLLLLRVLSRSAIIAFGFVFVLPLQFSPRSKYVSTVFKPIIQSFSIVCILFNKFYQIYRLSQLLFSSSCASNIVWFFFDSILFPFSNVILWLLCVFSVHFDHFNFYRFFFLFSTFRFFCILTFNRSHLDDYQMRNIALQHTSRTHIPYIPIRMMCT